MAPFPESEAAIPQLGGWFTKVIELFAVWDLQVSPKVPIPEPVSAVPQIRDRGA